MKLKAYLIMATGVVVITVASYVTAAWLIASIVTSSIKSINGACGQAYNIESVGVSGDWFCGDK